MKLPQSAVSCDPMFWIAPLLSGFGQGILISLLSFGPSFFTLINTGIQAGRAQGLRVALGIFLSEFAVAMACFFGLISVVTNFYFQTIFCFCGAVAILIIGFKNYRQEYQKFLDALNQPIKKNASLFKGFIANLMNPFVLFLWVGIIGSTSVLYKNEDNPKLCLLFNLIGVLFALFSLDIGKVFLSEYLGKRFSNKVYYAVNKYFGLILLLIGAFFLYHFVSLLNGKFKWI